MKLSLRRTRVRVILPDDTFHYRDFRDSRSVRFCRGLRHVFQSIDYRTANLHIFHPAISDFSVGQRSTDRR